MAIQVPNLVNAFLQGQQARQDQETQKQKNELLQMQLENAPREQAARNALLDLQLRGEQQQYDIRGQQEQRAQTQGLDQKRQGALKQVGSFSQQALASGDPRAFADALLRNPAHAAIFADAGIDPAEALAGIDSPDFLNNLKAAASFGDQVSADARFRAETDAAAKKEAAAARLDERKFTAEQNELNRQNQRDIAWMRNDPNAPGNKPKLTEGERSAANYLLRMGEAEPKIEGYKPSVADQVAFSRALNSGSEIVSALGNSVLSPEAQSYYQAASDWVRAKLRKESGAVIAPAEMVQEIKTYFPMPGDSAAVVEQKRQARLTAQEGMRGMAGGAAPPKDPAGGAPSGGVPDDIAAILNKYK